MLYMSTNTNSIRWRCTNLYRVKAACLVAGSAARFALSFGRMGPDSGAVAKYAAVDVGYQHHYFCAAVRTIEHHEI